MPGNKKAGEVGRAFTAPNSPRCIQDCPEPEVCRAEIDLLGMAGRWAVAGAVVGRAQMRSAFDHPRFRLAGSKTDAGALRAGGIDCGLARMAWAIPIARPFPNVADHVVEAVAVRLEASNRCGSHITV